ncbi:MAG: hypothetical protein ACRD0K_10445 [Egibacteraceae bacterium]
MYELRFAKAAAQALTDLEQRDRTRLRRVRKTLGLLQANPRHPGLNSHRYESFPGQPTVKVWDSYSDQGAGASRIFWTYGPDEKRGGEAVRVITVLAITPHP